MCTIRTKLFKEFLIIIQSNRLLWVSKLSLLLTMIKSSDCWHRTKAVPLLLTLIIPLVAEEKSRSTWFWGTKLIYFFIGPHCCSFQCCLYTSFWHVVLLISKVTIILFLFTYVACSLFAFLISRKCNDIQKQSSGGVLWKRCSWKFHKIQRKTPVSEFLFLTKLVCNFIKKEALSQVFSCEFREIFQNIFFFKNTSGGCFRIFW